MHALRSSFMTFRNSEALVCAYISFDLFVSWAYLNNNLYPGPRCLGVPATFLRTDSMIINPPPSASSVPQGSRYRFDTEKSFYDPHGEKRGPPIVKYVVGCCAHMPISTHSLTVDECPKADQAARRNQASSIFICSHSPATTLEVCSTTSKTY